MNKHHVVISSLIGGADIASISGTKHYRIIYPDSNVLKIKARDRVIAESKAVTEAKKLGYDYLSGFTVNEM